MSCLGQDGGWGVGGGNIFFTKPRTLNIYRKGVISEASEEFLEEEA